MTEPDQTLNEMMQKPRVGFLIASGVSALLAVLAYIYEEDIVGAGQSDSSLTYAILLMFLVLASMFLMVCYRQPSLGNKLLGYHRLKAQPKMTAKSDVQYSAGFKSETGVETKRMNSRRKQARHSRKRFAAVTREMQQQTAEQISKDNS